MVAWNDPQTVTVSAAADADGVDDTARLTFTLESTGDNDYDELSVSAVDVEVTDTVRAGLAVSRSSLSVTPGRSQTYTIKLTAPPSDNVTVTPAASDDSG